MNELEKAIQNWCEEDKEERAIMLIAGDGKECTSATILVGDDDVFATALLNEMLYSKELATLILNCVKAYNESKNKYSMIIKPKSIS